MRKTGRGREIPALSSATDRRAPWDGGGTHPACERRICSSSAMGQRIIQRVLPRAAPPGGGDEKNRRGSAAAVLRVCWMRAQASLALAISVRAVNAALSLTASSASILRLISTPAFFRPFIKVE